MAGHRCLLGVDKDKYALQTFAHNHKHAQVFVDDIQKLTTKRLTELTGSQQIHAVVGGPPCQGFSTVGTGDPNDERNSLFRQFVRIVKITNPYFVIVENVTGLLATKNENTLKSIFKEFNKLGYNLDVKVMSAHNYGVPEKRRRTIIIGTKINAAPIFPNPTTDVVIGKSHIPSVTVGDVIFDLKTKKGELFNHDLKSAKIPNKIDEKRLAKIPEGKGIRYEKDEKAFLTAGLKLGVNWDELPECRFRQTKYQRLDRKEPSPTIMTHRHSYYHPTENRYLTAREAAKIQSFPNDFVFMGPVSAQWRQIGNAVPPLLGKALGESLSHMYKFAKKPKKGTKQEKISFEDQIERNREKAFVY